MSITGPSFRRPLLIALMVIAGCCLAWSPLLAVGATQETSEKKPDAPPAQSGQEETAQQQPAASPQLSPEEIQAQADKNNQAIAKRMVAAVDHLIPGEYLAASPIPDALQKIALSMLEGNVESANEQLKSLAAEHAELPPPPLIMAAMYFTINQTEPGRLALERAAIDFPDYPGVYTALARLSINEGWWASSAALLAQLRQRIDAGTWSDEQKKQFESEYLDAMADTVMGQRKLDLAREHLVQLLELLPDNASVPYRLAEVDFRQGKPDDALKNLAKARALDVNLYPPELVLFQWSTRQNKLDEAKGWIEKASQKFPDERSVQIEYGRYLLEQGELTQAAQWIDRAEKGGANRGITRFLQAQIAFMRRAYQVAEASFRELAMQNPNDVAVRNMLALSLIESEDATKKQQALEIANVNFRFQPNNPQLASTLGWVLYRLGNTQQAKQILSQITSRPSFPSDTAFYLARMFIDEGQDAGAEQILTRSLEAPGLFLYRLRAEEDLAGVKQRLAEKGNAPKPETADDKK